MALLNAMSASRKCAPNKAKQNTESTLGQRAVPWLTIGRTSSVLYSSLVFSWLFLSSLLPGS